MGRSVHSHNANISIAGDKPFKSITDESTNGLTKGRNAAQSRKRYPYHGYPFIVNSFSQGGPGPSFLATQVNPRAGIIPLGDSGFTAAKQKLSAVLKKAEDEERKQITEPDESREPNLWLRRVELAKLIADGELKIPIGKTFKLDEIFEAHRCMEENKAGGKIVVLV